MESSNPNRTGQRRRPELNINTSSAIPTSRHGRPTTPPTRKPPVPAGSSNSKGKPPVSSRGFKIPDPISNTTSTRRSEESFLDNDSPVDPGDSEVTFPPPTRRRLSHDLSLPTSKVTRDSLVTNMLSSLDKFSLSQVNTPVDNNIAEEDNYGSPSEQMYTRSMTSVPRPSNHYSSSNSHSHSHGYGHGYSYSSDFEANDDAASKISSQPSRGRRSNSSSGFQSTLGRINSVRERSHPGASAMRVLHSRGGKTSKSSSTNSIVDGGGFAQVLPTQRWAHGIGGRSSSFDYSQRPSLNSTNAWKSEFSDTFLVDDYEAAPTPNVPGGPRRPPQPSTPVALPLPPEPKTPEHKKSTARTRSATSKSSQPKHGHSRDVPPLASVDLNSAPAPLVGYGKSKEPPKSIAPSSTPLKERPGFFSRLFGSSRNSSILLDTKLSPGPSAVVENVERPGSRTQHVVSQMAQAQSVPPSRDATHAPERPHIIQKKSSFFRRRKKSVAEPPPPPMPQSMELGKAIETLESLTIPEPSPISSLRQVMNPYLKSSTPTTPGGFNPPRDGLSRSHDRKIQEGEKSRRVRGFSPDYEPSPSATIRAVKSASALQSQESLDSSARIRGHMESPTRDPPVVPLRLSNSTNRRDTFLVDSSDDGDRSRHMEGAIDLAHGSDLSSPVIRQSIERTQGVRVREQLATGHPSVPKPEPSPSLLLQNNAMEEEDDEQAQDRLALPIESSDAASTRRPVLSRAESSVPSVLVNSADASPDLKRNSFDEPVVSVGEPTEDDRQKAQRIFDGNEDFIQKEKAAAWMGEEGLVRQRTLRAYMDLYNFKNQSVISALRQVCNRLLFRAETQQVDRILVAFSKRWCECNPNHGFRATDVIHTMCYSIMLLNTDLHLADIEHKMTRSQFVKNTMTTVKHALVETVPEIFNRNSILPGKNVLLSPTESETPGSLENDQERPSWRYSFKPPLRSESSTGFDCDSPVESCGPLVKAPFDGSLRAWETQVEIVLKDIYTSIRDERLPLFGADPNHQTSHQQQSGLSVIGMLKRTPSVLSKAPSEGGQSSHRGRINDPSRSNSRWNSKSRSRPRVTANGFSSSRTSFEDGNSIWSPTLSSATWSRYSLGRTHTSMSIDSLGSSYPHGDYQQSIGFANALSQAIIREDVPVGDGAQSVMSDDFRGVQLLEDESLELLGPPWMKEGLLVYKHHLDGIDKKAKDRNWTEVFAVVQKGTMSLFSFSSKSMRQKSRMGRKHAPGAVVGGGNWQENATSVGTFSLRQTLASTLPPPGYSRSRPHVWALSLPTGAVHLFQVGTPEISKEFVLTVNYWSSRLSTHPLVGGISNVEYGWSDAIINNALVTAINDITTPQRPGSATAGRTSMHSRQGSRQSSIRSSFDHVNGSSRGKLPGDRIHIAEWTPPAQSLRPSNCSEAEQLETLTTYVRSIEDDLQRHNQLRSPMLIAFAPRGHNSTKAMANWERKSSYLLREIVKFRTYVDSLQQSAKRRGEVLAERENAQRAARGEDLSDGASVRSEEEGEGDTTIKPE